MTRFSEFYLTPVQMFHGPIAYHLPKSPRSFKLPAYKVRQTPQLFAMADRNLQLFEKIVMSFYLLTSRKLGRSVALFILLVRPI
jgi:hypothetical protein